MNLISVPLEKLTIPEGRRAVNTARVKNLADSIKEIGLAQPIGVRVTADGYVLVWGRHRVEAYRLLGEKVIPANGVELDDLHAEMAEIDENICRSGLTKADESKALSRRKEIYEALHPETKQHKAGGHAKHKSASDKMSLAGGKKRQSDNVSFSQDTAAKTGKTARTIERSVALGKNLDDKALASLKASNNPILNKAGELAKLAKHAPKEQRAIAAKLAFGQLHRVPEVPGKTGGKVAKHDADMPRHQVDDNGEQVPERLLPIFEARPQFVEMERKIRELSVQLQQLAGQPWGKHIGVDDWRDLKGLADRVRDAVPSVVVDAKTWLPRGAK